MRLLLSTILILVLSFPAMADEFVYAPDDCEFKMVFPDEPYAARRCHQKMQDKCDLVTGYTQVFGVDATINFYVTCKPAEPHFRENFTPDIIRTTLLARPGVSSLEAYDISYSENDLATMSALLGAGPTPNGQDVMIYVTQIWVGDGSVLSLEGELIGDGVDEADKLFGKILGSLRHKDWKPEEASPAEDSNAQSDEDYDKKDSVSEKKETPE